jgi:hypothetical protein
LHFVFILHGLGLFDQDSITREYNSMPPGAREHAIGVVEDLANTNKSMQENTITHKQMLEAIRGHT